MATSTITGTITGPTGVAVAGARVVCKLMPSGGFRSADGSEVARAVETTTNASGVYSFVLERNSGITPANTWYELTEYIPVSQGGTRVWNIQVGASNQTVLAALITPLPASQASNYLTQAAADARYQALSAIGSDTPSTIDPDDAASAGVSTAASRGDHQHAITAAAPVAIGTSLAEGVATSFARSDHVHTGPLGALGYAQVTADQTGIGAADTDLTGLAVTVTVGAGRRVRITGHCLWRSDTANVQAIFRIKEGATQLQATVAYNDVPSNVENAGPIVAVLTPSAGSHTYKLSLSISGGANPVMGANAAFPAFILVEDIGT